MTIVKPGKMFYVILINLFLCLGIFFALLSFNIIQINPRFLLKEGIQNEHVFFSEDDIHDKNATGWERNQEQGRVNNEIKEYFNNDFDENLGNINSSGSGYFCDLTGVNKRLNYMQHTIDELRGMLEKVGGRFGIGKKLH